ncbi:MAG: hypothetical protein ACQEXJ_00455 [Myxococcota bacterium]
MSDDAPAIDVSIVDGSTDGTFEVIRRLAVSGESRTERGRAGYDVASGWRADRGAPSFLVGIFLALAGLQVMLFDLLVAEIAMRIDCESQGKRTDLVRETVNLPEDERRR